MESTLQVNGKFVVEVIDKDGNLKQRVEQHNRVVDTGLEQIASLIAGPNNDSNYISIPTHCAIGSESRGVTSSDTKLINELYRNVFDKVTRTGNDIQYKTTFLPAQPDISNCRVEEVGLFNAATEGCMLNRCVFQPVYKTRSDTLIITYTLTIMAVTSTHDEVLEDETPSVNR